ncbi:BQ2448_2064 [Microbotryum intermedium]|uniref:BQ2448_2064 protein n=1 Tax=Microbotryum intermedium TaxID=269621 RepID=A0A238FAX6_9BASI|nr:BQ2448_2064 [Microbotryum intermedium]
MLARARDRESASRSAGTRIGQLQGGMINTGSTLTHPPLEWVACLGCLRSHPSVSSSTDPWDDLYITTCCHVLCARCAFGRRTDELAATAHQSTPKDLPSNETLDTLSLSCAVCFSNTQFMVLDENIPRELAPCFRPLASTLEDLSAATHWQVDHLALQVAWLRHKCERQKGNLTKLVQELKRVKGHLGLVKMQRHVRSTYRKRLTSNCGPRRKIRELEQENERLRALVSSLRSHTQHGHKFRVPRTPEVNHPVYLPRENPTQIHKHRPGHDIAGSEAHDDPRRPQSAAASLPDAPARYSLPTSKNGSSERQRPISRASSTARSPPRRSASVSTKSPRNGPYREKLASYIHDPLATPRPHAPARQVLGSRPASAQSTTRASQWLRPSAPQLRRASTAQGIRQQFEPVNSAQYRARQELAGLGKIDEETTTLNTSEAQWGRYQPPTPSRGMLGGTGTASHVDTGAIGVSTPRQRFIPHPANAPGATDYNGVRSASLPRGFQTAGDLHRLG